MRFCCFEVREVFVFFCKQIQIIVSLERYIFFFTKLRSTPTLLAISIHQYDSIRSDVNWIVKNRITFVHYRERSSRMISNHAIIIDNYDHFEIQTIWLVIRFFFRSWFFSLFFCFKKKKISLPSFITRWAHSQLWLGLMKIFEINTILDCDHHQSQLLSLSLSLSLHTNLKQNGKNLKI